MAVAPGMSCLKSINGSLPPHRVLLIHGIHHGIVEYPFHIPCRYRSEVEPILEEFLVTRIKDDRHLVADEHQVRRGVLHEYHEVGAFTPSRFSIR